MKTAITVINIFMALITIGITLYLFLAAYAGGMSPTGFGGMSEGKLFLMVAVVVVIGASSIIFSHSDSVKRNLIVSLLPFILLLPIILSATLGNLFQKNSRGADETEKSIKQYQKKIAGVSRNFVCALKPDLIEKFITLDTESNSLIAITIRKDKMPGEYSTYPVGNLLPAKSVSGDSRNILAVFNGEDDSEKFFTQYDSCVSADNKTLSEKYYVEYGDSSPKEYLSDYPLKKYQ